MSVQLLGESPLEYMLEDIMQFYNRKAGDSGVQVVNFPFAGVLHQRL